MLGLGTTDGRILIQSDWDVTYKDGSGRFWISCKKPGVDTVHSFISCERISDGSTSLEPENSAFKIDHFSPRHIAVAYQDINHRHTTTFKAKSKEFNIYGKNKKIIALDVTNGGLGLSSFENSSDITIWETNIGAIRRELSGHVGDIYVAKFFPSGVVVLSSGADMQLKIWSVESGNCAATLLGHKAAVHDVAFVERGRNVVSCSRDGTAKLWDVSEQKCIHTYESDNGLGVINSCDLSFTNKLDLGSAPEKCCEKEVGTDGKLLIVGTETCKVTGFGLHSKKKVLDVNHSSAVNCVKFLNDIQFVSGTQDGHISIYDIRSPSSPIKEWVDGRAGVLSICSYKQGFLYSTNDGSTVCVDETLSQNFELTGPDCDPVYKVVNAGNELFTSSRDGLVRVYTL